MQNAQKLKSLSLGIVIGALAVLAIAAETKETPAGRYSIAAGNGYFVKIDTATGQIWFTSAGVAPTAAGNVAIKDFVAPNTEK